MKSFSQRGLLLFGVLLVVCAFGPSMASAASWSPIGTTHQLFGTDVLFSAVPTPLGAAAGSTCVASEFDSDVVSANTIVITDARFKDCMGSGAAGNCTATVSSTGLPWTATATATSNVQIHGVNIDVLFENTPGNPNACAAPGAKVLLTGTLTGASWQPATNQVQLAGATGLTAHFLGFNTSSPTTVQGTIEDTAGTLRMFM
jgi:hypothetical protein